MIQALTMRWRWFYYAAGLSAVGMVLLFMKQAQPPTAQTLSLPLLDNARDLLIIFSLACFFLGTLLRALPSPNWTEAMPFVLFACALVMIIGFLGPARYPVWHIDSKIMSEQRYELVVYPPPDGSASTIEEATSLAPAVYVLFACDSANILCHAVFSRQYEHTALNTRVGERQFLSANGDRITLRIHGEQVYAS